MFGLGVTGRIPTAVGPGGPATGNPVRASGPVGLPAIGRIALTVGFGLKATGIDLPKQKSKVATINLPSRWGIYPSLFVIRMWYFAPMKRQILQLLLSAGIAAFFATGCCYPKQVAVVKKTPVLAPTGPVIAERREVVPPDGPVIAEKTEVLPPTGPILVKEYTIPPRPAEVVVVTSVRPVAPVESGWYFTGIRWVWLP